MVMEAPPSPQCVGREFVRQYYTLLNKAPAHLHRFYNNNSSFVHGGLDAPNREPSKPVVGQVNIHQKIQQLNFRDCHAKISQVDSQSTLGDGVVVQVTGELSNNGQPMRRFTQTFVLAAQAPKKYYVHNDIFRYQDMLITDEDIEQDSARSEADEDQEAEHTPPSESVQASQQMITSQALYYNTNPTSPTNTNVLQPTAPLHQTVSINGAVHHEEVLSPSMMAQAQEVHREEDEEEEEEQHLCVETAEECEEPEELPADEEDKVQPPELFQEDVQHYNELASNEPKTYATSLKSGGQGMSAGIYSSSMNTSPNASTKPSSTSPPLMPTRLESKENLCMSGLSSSGAAGIGSGQRGARGRCVRGVSRDRPGRGAFHEENGNVGGDGDRRRTGSIPINQQYGDSHQLFLGNLPYNATEDELKNLFSKFGTVVDLRIHNKPNPKNSGGGRVANYGFITFEEESSADQVLKSKPIYYPDETGQKLNVEEKKAKPRMSLDGGRMNSGGDAMMGGRGGPSMGGGSRGSPGIMRGPSVGHRGGGRSSFSRGDNRMMVNRSFSRR